MVVLFSTFFSSFAGGVTTVVFFSTTGAGVSTRASHAAKRSVKGTRIAKDFILGVLRKNEPVRRARSGWRTSSRSNDYLSVVVVVVVVFFSSMVAAGAVFTTAFRTMTLVATILSPTLA